MSESDISTTEQRKIDKLALSSTYGKIACGCGSWHVLSAMQRDALGRLHLARWADDRSQGYTNAAGEYIPGPEDFDGE